MHCINCVLEVKAQMQSSAAVSNKSLASQSYAQAQPKKYCTYCVSEEKAQMQSSAVVQKKR